MFQDYKLLPNKTVYENVAFAQEVIGRPRHVIDAQVPQILDLVGLSRKSNRFPTELSGGEQQRVSIARALLTEPEIVLADEPTGNLDTRSSGGVLQLLSELNESEGQTLVIVSHDPAAASTARRVVFLRDGRLAGEVEGGSTDRVVAALTELDSSTA